MSKTNTINSEAVLEIENPRLAGNMTALLKQSHDLLENAERTIAKQQKRIAELEALAATDPLTGLMNRRAFDLFLQQEVSRIERGNSPSAILIMIDLDRFKGINDTLGHGAGDACLKTIAQKLNALVRLTDGAARLGGDEFALLFTHTTLEKLGTRLDKIRGELSAMRFQWLDADLPFSASTGWTEITEDMTAEQAYCAADENLYRQKNIGSRKS
jgi:diguanylate cyclase (GGDEF)-like protein